jgi:SAM-dependent methyltransferase
MRDAIRGLLRRLGLLGFVRSSYRSAIGICRDVAWKCRNRCAGSPGNPLLPPPSLCFRSAVSYDPLHFLESGGIGAGSVRRSLQEAGRPLKDCRDVLDFGSGCCRVMRHFNVDLAGSSISAVDVDRGATEWIGENLPDVSVSHLSLGEGLPFGSDRFDLVLAIAVFPNLSADHQLQYVEEIRRVLVPGGILLLTLKGAGRRHELTADDRLRFDAGEVVEIEPECSGSHYCLVYNPESYVRREMVTGFRVLRFRENGSTDTSQDLWILEKS